jgi:hypothetical protein
MHSVFQGDYMRLHPTGRFDNHAVGYAHIEAKPLAAAIWDNRLCLHQAYNDYQGHRREMYRTTVAGEVPA